MSTGRKTRFPSPPTGRSGTTPSEAEREKLVASFIEGAEAKAVVPTNDRWSEYDDHRSFPGFSLRYTERERAMLKFAAGAIGISSHEFCHQAIFAKVAEVLETVDQGNDARTVTPFDRKHK